MSVGSRSFALTFRAMLMRTSLSIAIGTCVASMVGGAQEPAKAASKQASDEKKKVKKAKSDQPLTPADSAKAYAKRRKDAAESEALPIFASREPLTFTLSADFRSLSRDRDTLSTKQYPATVAYSAEGREVTIPVKLMTRGHFRLSSRNCSFVPIRLLLPKKATDSTVFDKQQALKLVTHCDGSRVYDQKLLQEHLAYRIYNLLTPRSFRTRLAKVTYIDTVAKKTLDTRYAMLIENEDDLARRNLSKMMNEERGAVFADVDTHQLLFMTLFEYMIGNTDWSLYALHNVRVMRSETYDILPIPYDLDFSGLIGARYASPDPRLGIKTVKERLFRGPCHSAEEWAPVLEQFRARKSDIMALYGSIPDLDKGAASDAREFLNDFYRVIEDPRSVKRELIDGCLKKPGA